MINAKTFINELNKIGIEFYTGVPDSLMSEFSKSLHFDFDNKNHVIATNEGSALAMCMGFNLATNKIPLIYMQNSGLGNFVNPYTSLLHKDIYDIPFILLVGWRGEPGVKDEPQHIFQGKITLELLKLLEIKYIIIDENTNLEILIKEIKENIDSQYPLALVIRKNTFEKDDRAFESNNSLPKRNEALEKILNLFDEKTLYISTTGKLSRELYEIRKISNQTPNDLYVVGGMGHASSIAYGINQNLNENQVVCLDGDGSLLMHMGSLGIIGQSNMKNFIHVIFNNSSHESVGGQPNIYSQIDSNGLAKSLGYKNVLIVKNIEEFDHIDTKNFAGPTFIEVKVQNSSDRNLLRPDKTPEENKKNFMEKVHNDPTNY